MAFLANSPASARCAHARSPLRAATVEASSDRCAEAGARVALWRQDLACAASSEAQQALRELCHEREYLADLQADLAGVQGLVKAASRLHAGGAKLADVVHRSVGASETRAEALASVRDEFLDLCETHREELVQEEREIVMQREAADAKHAEALKLLAVYRDQLGLSISREAPQAVRMVFTAIDRSDLAREFLFTLGLGNAEKSCHKGGYCVSECVPSVPELPRLLEELNADASSASSLPRFVCSMRRAFRKQVDAPCEH